MAGSEYNHDFFPNFNFPSRSINLEVLQELEEEAAMEAVNPNFHKPRARLQRSSRMQRLSTFLPALSTSPNKSKHSKDTQPPPLPRKPAPLPFNQNASTSRPPTRDAPPAPLSLHHTNDAMLPLPQKRLQKSDSPNRLKALPNSRSDSPSRIVTTGSSGNNSRRNSILAMIPGQSRSASSPIGSRPTSFYSGEDNDPASGSKIRRKSFLPGGKSRSRNTSKDTGEEYGTGAWVNAGDHKIDYNLALLTSGEKVNICCVTKYNMLNFA